MFCQKCGKMIPEGVGKVVDGHLLCEDCAEASVKHYCQRCGKELPPGTAPQENGKLLCESCAALPDDSDQDQAFWDPARSSKRPPKPGMLPFLIGALSLVVVVAAIGIMLATKTLCLHKWQPATCTEPEICLKCGKIHGAPIPHKWKEATCTEPRTCMLCGVTEGKPLGHTWVAATCTTPKTCSLCGETQGKAAGHKWLPATCEAPKTCEVCGATEGLLGAHEWMDADCEHPRTCTVCGETQGEPLGHVWLDATCTEPKTCEVCGATEGEPIGHKWKAATVLSPKTCEICGETEGEKLSIFDMLPFELMDVEKGDFIDATGDAHHESIGCDDCYRSQSTLVSDLFPGCVFAFGDSSESKPTHIHVFDGYITDDTYVGMTYQQLESTMGKPSWYLDEKELTASAQYTIDGYTVNYVFTDAKVFADIVNFQRGKNKQLTISKPNTKVAAVRIS